MRPRWRSRMITWSTIATKSTPCPPCLVLSRHIHGRLYHSIGDRGDTGGDVYFYKRLNFFTLYLVLFRCYTMPQKVSGNDVLRLYRHADFWRKYKGVRTSLDEPALRFETFLIGKMPTRLFACSSAFVSPARRRHVTVLAPSCARGQGVPLSLRRAPRQNLSRIG
jgi:hypothetical protein